MATTRFINPSTMSKPIGFSHVVDITGPGRIIYIAGQLGVDTDGKVAGSLRAQIAQAFVPELARPGALVEIEAVAVL
jgi:enamine deaminase RidA (YjgF/YER057c/UK114 family)